MMAGLKVQKVAREMTRACRSVLAALEARDGDRAIGLGLGIIVFSQLMGVLAKLALFALEPIAATLH